MGGLLTLGIVIALLGMGIMSGLMQTLIDLTGNLFIFGGIAAAVIGGAYIAFGGIASKIWGIGLVAAGIAVAIMGVVMKFVLDLWIIHWLIEFGGMTMLIVGAILAGIGLIGMFRGDSKRYSGI